MDLDNVHGLQDPISGDLSKINVTLQEDELRRIGRAMASLFSRKGNSWDDNALDLLQVLLDRLLQTAEEPRLTAGHRAASCNALAAFLEQAAALPVSEMRIKLLGNAGMTRAFQLYLKRSGDSQSKPMRQLLRVLVKLLLADSSNVPAAMIVHDIVKICLAHISPEEDFSCAKAAMTLVTMFIQKRLISVNMLLMSERAISLIENQNIKSQSGSDLQISSQNLHSIMSGFVSQLMGWLRYPDTGPAAGRLVLALFAFIDDAIKLDDSLAASTITSRAAMWVVPVLDAVRLRPELIENLEQHLLPELLRMDLSHTEELFRTLPIKQLCMGNIGCLTDEELRLCLVVIRMAEELGATALLDDYMNRLDLHNLSYTQHLSTDLLVHDSASVRILALRSFTYSASSILPLPSHLLFTLRQVLPYFHAETDSAARNEFCSIIKKLFSRIQAAMHRLTKRSCDLRLATTQSEASMESSLEEDSKNLKDHTLFISWYVELLQKELQPTASYSRHISALKVLQHLIAFGLCTTIQSSSLIASQFQSQEFSKLVEPCKNSFIHLLLELVMDPFDDVRTMAAAVLEEHYLIVATEPLTSRNAGPSVPSGVHSDSSLNDSALELALQRSADLSRRTGRADYADGVGRLYDVRCLISGRNKKSDGGCCERYLLFERLISGLELDIQLAHDNLQTAIVSAPLHGHLIALRYIINRKGFLELLELDSRGWRRMHNRLVHCFSMVWTVVKDVVCYDSPEGHIFTEVEEVESDVNVKDALSYSWRALKETSALIHAMISNPGYSPSSSYGGLSYEDLKTLGDLTLTQLAELRHRGAFSTVSQTFLGCCIRCAASEDSDVVELPGLWYKEALICIEAKAAALTRRSAGLPAMITGILAAYPNGSFFDQVILDLQKIANAPVVRTTDHTDIRLSQVHALNCLKDVFTNSRLGSSTENHLATTLVIAINCLQRDVWAIRNCGLMLLKALLTRLVGGSGKTPRPGSQAHSGYLTSRITYDGYGVLADLVLRLLQHQSTADLSAESTTVNYNKSNTIFQSIQMVFPAMEIIERIGVAARHKLLVEQLLLTYVDSPVWSLRDKAAMILSSMVEKKLLFNNVYSVMQGTPPKGPNSHQNAVHGRLLCLKYMIEGQRHNHTGRVDIHEALHTLAGLLRINLSTDTARVSVAVLLDVLSSTVETLLLSRFQSVLRSGRQCLLSEDIKHIALLPGKEHRNQDLLQNWKRTVQVLSQITSNSRIHATDSYISALAHARVLSALSETTISDHDCITLNVLRCLNEAGNIAFYAGIKCFNNMHKMFDPLKVQPLQIYTTLLQQVAAADSRIALMEGLSTFLSLPRQLDKTDGLPTSTAPMTFGDEHTHLISWGQQEQITDSITTHTTLKLRGALLAHECKIGSLEDPKLKRKLEIWARMLKLAGEVKSDLSTRLAAATSIDCFKHAFRPEHSGICSPLEFLGIYLALYDVLLDDDDEVRGIGALVVSWIFSSPNSSPQPASKESISLSPMAAVDKMLSLLTTAYCESSVLLYEALSRLTGRISTITYDKNTSGSTPVRQLEICDFLSPIRDLFDIARKEDTALFVEEKQNLYIDPAQESQRWASVLIHISSAALTDSTISFVVEWVCAGLERLVDIAGQEAGGPLGWMTKPEVFTLGLRVLETIRVLQNWDSRGLVRQSPNLKSLMTKFQQADIHPVWLSRVPKE